MTVAAVPTSNETHQVQTTTLEGSTFLLNLDYSTLCNCWYMSIYTEEGDPIYTGIKLVCNWPLLHKCADSRLPPGEMICWSNTTDTSPAGLNDLLPGARCELLYIDSTDYP